jgi:hypothetical protein
VNLQLLTATNAADPAAQWFVDRRGWMRPAKYVTACLTSSSNTGTSATMSLGACVSGGTNNAAAGLNRQVWTFQDVGTFRIGH